MQERTSAPKTTARAMIKIVVSFPAAWRYRNMNNSCDAFLFVDFTVHVDPHLLKFPSVPGGLAL